jgi:UDP-xylose:glucoside alpha-1,3-xylosyltransferase
MLSNKVVIIYRFSDKHIGGLTRESEGAKQSGYDTFATLNKCPFPAPAGLNSAVFLMHLDRMRQINWTNSLTWILNNYVTCINLGDQDMLNIYFYFHNTSFYTLPCSFNYRTDHCIWDCFDASQHGVAILHANRQMLLRNVKHPHRSIFDIISRFGVEDFNPSNSVGLLNLLLNAVWTNLDRDCRRSNILTRGLLNL